MINGDAKLRALGPALGYPHSSAVRGTPGLRELRPVEAVAHGGASTSESETPSWSLRWALIYQHATREADRAIADGLEARLRDGVRARGGRDNAKKGRKGKRKK